MESFVDREEGPAAGSRAASSQAMIKRAADVATQEIVAPGFLRKLGAALVFGGATWLAAGLGSSVSKPGFWYRTLRKGRGQPPSSVFGPVWTTLYTAMAYSAWRVWRAPDSPERTRALRLWGAQLGLNAAWSPTFFGAKSPKAALAIVAALLPTLARYIRCAARVDRTAAAIMAPYLAWTGFATYLNGAIVAKNRRR